MSTSARITRHRPLGKRRTIYEMPLELEPCAGTKGTVEYTVRFEIEPGERETRDCPGYGPSIDWYEVVYERRGRDGKVVQEPRPELDALVNEDALLNHVGAEGDDVDWDSIRKARLEDGGR